MGKRAAAKMEGQAKSARTAAEDVPKSEDELFSEACAPVFKLLQHASDVPDTARGMLVTMAPHCLRTPKTERHSYQSVMVEVLTGVVTNVVSNQRATIEATKAAVAEMDTGKVTAAETLSTVTAECSAKEADRDAKDAVVSEAMNGVNAAEEDVKRRKEEFDDVEASKTKHLAERAQYEELVVDRFTVLKDSSLAGKEWRKRNKFIEEVAEKLEKIGLETSLTVGLSVAFKTGAGERGRFATKCVEYGEAALTDHIKSLEGKMANHGADVAEKAQGVTAAEEGLQNANTVLAQKQEELASTTRELRQANAERKTAERALKALGPAETKLGARLKVEESTLVDIQDLVVRFEELKDRAAPVENAEGATEAEVIDGSETKV